MIPGIVAQEFSVPPMSDKFKNKNSDYSSYAVKYYKADMDDLTDMAELELLMTKSIDGSGDIVVLKEEAYVFMAQRFICIQYLEKRAD